MVHHFNEIFIQILILLAIALAVIGIAQKLNRPYSIALVLVGLLLGMINIPVLEQAETYITQSNVFQAIVISLFLPILLGDATLKLPFSHLREQSKPVVALAFGGTLLSFVLIALGSYYLLGLPLVVACTFAALMSATDPISVISIFKSLGVPKKLTTVIEGESLLNDGIAVVLFQISSIYLLSYLEMGWAGVGSGLLLFLQFAVGGTIVGLILGYIFSRIIVYYDNYPFETALSAVLFFGCYFIAEHLQVSGVIAVVVGGLVFGSYGRRVGMSETTHTNIDTFWDTIALIANSLIFLMIGLEIRNIDLSGRWPFMLLAILIVLIARSGAVYLSLAPVKGFESKFKHILNWGGLKGSLSIALALSLPIEFEGREDILALAFGVVLFSLLFQGLSIEKLILKLGVAPRKPKGKRPAENEA
ncbi:cation:proton antiporter [Saccharibacillus alkalitolerans]|uniref:Sodium:proton antiporter n=1 Tax=Saccharibacillus alkalitolerans TaxID=2705290 RepID=A0ABX0F6P9_9BACL|nr:sodium:proton antiporter [Saccharibacillus alkalitolerans]NGZ76642.1 sodium:proton antiporter [Saccharibacillus alkalitolerans]